MTHDSQYLREMKEAYPEDTAREERRFLWGMFWVILVIAAVIGSMWLPVGSH